jgi:UPF0716 protein FxsA
LAYFLIYLFIEVMISSFFISILGGFLTFLEIIITAVIGLTLLKNFNSSLEENIMKIRTGQMGQEEFIATNASRSIGALLLILPGFFTDILGILLQFGILLGIFGFLFKHKKPKSFQDNYHYTQHTQTTHKGEKNDEIIDVEIIEHNSSAK